MDGQRMSRPDTERTRRFYDRSAPLYDPWIAVVERLLIGDGRAWLGARTRGEVLEVGVGTGRNLGFFPPLAQLTGVDVSPVMLRHARRRAASLGRAVDLQVADAERLPFSDERFDTVVFSLALCSIPDDGRALREASRVLRPGGRLLLLEHVRSRVRAVRAVQRVLDVVTSRLLCDHLVREPLDRLEAAGFQLEELHRSRLGIAERVQATKATGASRAKPV